MLSAEELDHSDERGVFDFGWMNQHPVENKDEDPFAKPEKRDHTANDPWTAAAILMRRFDTDTNVAPPQSPNFDTKHSTKDPSPTRRPTVTRKPRTRNKRELKIVQFVDGTPPKMSRRSSFGSAMTMDSIDAWSFVSARGGGTPPKTSRRSSTTSAGSAGSGASGGDDDDDSSSVSAVSGGDRGFLREVGVCGDDDAAEDETSLSFFSWLFGPRCKDDRRKRWKRDDGREAPTMYDQVRNFGWVF